MAEEIKVVLEADARQLVGEFKKARQSAEEFSNKTLPLTTAEMTRLHVQQTRVAKGLRDGQQAVKNSGQGLLQLAQTADDAQYGMRGIMNNIPGLLMGLGAGAGLAGVASIAALALYGLHKGLKAVTGVDNMEAFDKSMEAAAQAGRDLTDTLQKQTTERRKAAELQNRMARLFDAEKARLFEILTFETARTRELELQETATARRRQIDDQIRAARQSLVTGPDAENITAAENRKLAAIRLEEDLAAAYTRSADASGRYSRLLQQTGTNISEKQKAVAILTARLNELEDINNRTQGALRGAEGDFKNAPARGTQRLRDQAQQNLAILRARNATEQEKLATLRAQLENEQNLLQSVRDRSQEQLSLAEQAAATQQEKVTAIREELELAEKLAAIEKERAAATEEARLQRELKARQDSMAAARRRYEDELIMKGNGDTTTATSAAETDRRRRIAIERVTATLRTERSQGNIRAALPRRGLQIGGLETSSRGLGPETRRRFGREDRPADTSLASKQAAFYVKALENDEKLIKAFEALGIL